MSCNATSRKLSAAGLAAGIAVLAGLGAYVVNRPSKQPTAPPRRLSEDISSRQLPDLVKQPRLLPLTPPPHATCAGCGAKPEKPGAWYRVGGQTYCVDCAPDAAKTAGVRLGSTPLVSEKGDHQPAASKGGGLRIIGAGGRPVRFKPEAVDLFVEGRAGRHRMVRHEQEAFAVMTGDDPSGLAIVRERTPQRGWALVHVDTGKSLARGFQDRYIAEGLAVQLTDINWNMPLEMLPDDAARRAGYIIGRFTAMNSE